MIDFKTARKDAEEWAKMTHNDFNKPMYGKFLEAVHNLSIAYLELGNRLQACGDALSSMDKMDT